MAVGIGGGSGVTFVGEGALGNVGHHDAGIETAFGHLVQIDEYAWVALVEMDVLVEEHRCVAVAVEGEDTAVYAPCLSVVGGFVCEPAEER